MNLANVDLNLLVVFEALYQTRNVTAAGRRLNRAQPSVSNALARLRTLLNDPLFVRSGGGMAPTPRAHQLMPQIRQVLEQIHLALAPLPVSIRPPPGNGALRWRPATMPISCCCPPSSVGCVRQRPASIFAFRVWTVTIFTGSWIVARWTSRWEGIFQVRKATMCARCLKSTWCASPAVRTHSWRMAAGIWRAISACRMGCTHRPTTALPEDWSTVAWRKSAAGGASP